MSIKDSLRDPYEDTRSDQEKKSDIRGAVLSVAALVALIAARRKMALTRGISKDIISAGLAKDSRYMKYLASNAERAIGAKPKSAREATLDKFEDMGLGLVDAIKDIFRPLPTGREQYHIAQNFLAKHLKYPINKFPLWEELGIKQPTFWEQMFYGPAVAPFKRGTSLGITGRPDLPKVVGQHGGMVIGRNLFFLTNPEAPGSALGYRIRNVFASPVNALGAHIERERRGILKALNPRTTSEYIRKVELAPSSVLEVETREFIKNDYLSKFNLNVGQIWGETAEDIERNLGKESLKGKTSKELREIASKRYADLLTEGQTWWTNPKTGLTEHIPSLEEYMGQRVARYDPHYTRKHVTNRRMLLERAAKTRRAIAEEAAKSPLAKARFKAFQVGRMLGVGEEFASYGGGAPQMGERFIRERAEWNYKHPVSGDVLPVTPRRYNVTGKTLGSDWEGGEGSWYLSSTGDNWKRWLSVLSGGSFHRVGEKAFGFGFSNRPNIATEFVREFIGSEKGSYSDLWIRNIGKTLRAVALGMGAYYTYKFVNYLSRKATGWGPTDVAAGAYVKYREFQQNVLQGLGVVNAAKTAENAFPGIISSPASQFARLAMPLIMASAFAKKGGPKGYALGLALGTATAMLTWGDISQSPEELHRIYSGEQEIPMRKGRYWLMGKTPFYGGKISYWKKHWYPLLKSQYKYKGGLWDSETEYWAQGTPFSPLLAPILTGKMWDPYYWEKKHYWDRPYPVTGEAFEPTMPFAWLANLTIGRILKPSTYMHQEYFGREQGPLTGLERGVPLYSGLKMGYMDIPGIGITRAQSPYSLRNQLSLAAYTQTEQMGLMGFAVNTIYSKLTGQTDFMSAQTQLQTSRRATGYERNYWERELGDPGAGLDEGLTEYFRRYLPHRRTDVDEYNPIANTMPDWLPGSDYFINFQQGDPYVKIPLGESRLPGKGYEALNQLHSGIPGSYDAVDRFMILANVAPYSNEYREYQYLAKAMVKDDEYWSKKVRRAIDQRNSLNQEYQFMDTSTKDVPLLLKPLSSIYRHGMAAITNFPNPLEMLPQSVAVGAVPAHINKWFPYKTPEATYRDFRLYGSEYAMWDQPFAGFITPFLRKVRGTFDQSYVPKAVERRREIQEYFDKLKYIKFSNLANVARDEGNAEMASSLSRIARNTMAMGPYHAGAAMTSVPKEEKSFFQAFSGATGEHRTRIMNMIPSYMRNYYMTAWNQQDKENGIGPSYDVDYQKSQDLTAYFRHHQLPPPNWLGWHPEVSLDQVKLRVVKNEAFDIHKFNLWDSNERQLARQPFTPVIDNINAPSNDLTMLQNVLVSNMDRVGLTNNRVFISRTPSQENSYKMNIRVNKDRTDDHNRAMRSSLSMR